jgi:predicted transcriptional regulator
MGRNAKLIDALGEMTAAAARADDREADIAEVTGLSEATVRRRLNEVSHGKTLVRNVFDDHWPGDEEEEDEALDADALGEMTVAAARADDREADIAEVTGLSEATVRRRLNEVSHGKTLVRNVFDDHWRDDDEEEDHVAVDVRPRGAQLLREVGVQGRPDHRKMQKSLADLGSLRRFHVRTNHHIGAGFKPDVLWFRLNPSDHTNAAPIAAFEIEFGSAQAIAKSLSSLKHAFDLGTQNLGAVVKHLPPPNGGRPLCVTCAA